MRLQQPFFARTAREVAHDLLGKRLIHQIDGVSVGGIIVETEAYCDDDGSPDLACHGSRNHGRPTAANRSMFGRPGIAYVYLTYGMHWMFNISTGRDGQANAVLIRAIEPTDGEHIMKQNRGKQPRKLWTNGPAKLTRALAIDKRFDGIDLCAADSPIWLENGIVVDDVSTGPRVGLGKHVPEPWFSIPWRYWVTGNRFVSAYR